MQSVCNALLSNIHPQDAWDGYRANRNRVLDHLYNNKISNTIILSGDSHANWVSDLARKRLPLSSLWSQLKHQRCLLDPNQTITSVYLQ